MGGGFLAAAASLALGASAAVVAVGGGCRPTITSHTSFEAGADPNFVIKGTCFGPSGTTTRTDSSHFGVVVFPPGTPVTEMETVVNGGTVTNLLHWSACSDYPNEPYVGPDGVTCNITSWTNTSITFSAFAGGDANIPSFPGYPHTFQFDYVSKKGDQMVVQVWNSQTGTGPATVYVTAGGAGSSLAVPRARVSSIGSSLPTPSKAFGSVKSDVVDAAITIGLALVHYLPGQLVQYDFPRELRGHRGLVEEMG